ncbi:site-specific DNA-methyltransferase [Candidatus Pacearchaeota archaeon]|jgi:site-specific DNA-methyltransferase (adenine-specific)/modification methylase|nr:site-specific DNA-methyltransferase [Candidatus Pacearchaeota archaeon]
MTAENAESKRLHDPWRKRVEIGDAVLYLGDCLEILPTLGKVDAVITDPPYGIGVDHENVSMSCGMRKDGSQRKYKAWAGARPKGYEAKDWDVKPDQSIFDAIFSASSDQIIWGGNYFGFPATGGWLVWDKMVTMTTLSKCEIAWTSFLGHIEIMHYLWAGFRKDKPEERFHPTQKPAEVMQWCIGFMPDAKFILDPFMGSGTTGVACANLGRRFIGIEIEERYFDIACKRIKDAYAQPRLFDDQKPQAKQMELEGMEAKL